MAIVICFSFVVVTSEEQVSEKTEKIVVGSIYRLPEKGWLMNLKNQLKLTIKISSKR